MAEMKTVTINGVTYTVTDPEALSGTDTTLTKANTAADAAAVGAALAGKAPAGYGLGGYAQEVSGQDIDAITVGGFYWWQDAVNTPFSWGYMIVAPANGDGYCTQTVYNMLDTCVVRRVKTDAGWVTEWVNPPMVPGVEYRTTERQNDEAVYAKLVDFGALPVNTISTVTATDGWYPLVELKAVMFNGNGDRPYYEMLPNNNAKIWYEVDAVKIQTYSDMSGYTAHIVIKYTKN